MAVVIIIEISLQTFSTSEDPVVGSFDSSNHWRAATRCKVDSFNYTKIKFANKFLAKISELKGEKEIT